ncbi:TldD/PmbA family protein [Hirschia litorea]|uniref:TldD/PmbA family protein n=1 Tax=Hirschia litorea TaxID=1199156 RepID=A0ABW2IJJ4_9PROT
MTYENKADILSSLIEATLKAGADSADASLATSESLSVEVRNGELEGVEREESGGVSLRALVGQRQAHVSGSDMSPDGLQAMVERVVAMAKAAPEDKYCGITPSDEIATEYVDLQLGGDESPSADMLKQRALEAEGAALGVEGVKQIDHAGATWSASTGYVAASNGFSAVKTGGSTSVSVVAIAEKDDAMERDYESWAKRKYVDMPTPASVGLTAAQRAIARLAPQKIKSQTAAVIYDRRLSSRLLSSFIGAISGPAVARGVSFLKDKMGEQVFADGVDVIDDPFVLGGWGSRWFDGEGRAVSKKKLIDNGVLTQWLLSGPSAKQLGLKPNGMASSGFGDPPGVTTTNLNLAPGKLDQAGLMKEAGKGLLVTDMFGPSINANTGDYSVGVSGFWFENGVIVHPVSEVTIAGELPAMFKRLVPGSDLEIRGSMNAPSVLIDGMSLAGL